MKETIKIILLFGLLFNFAQQGAAQKKKRPVKNQLQTVMNTYALKLKRENYPDDGRASIFKVIYGDLDRDGDTDAAALVVVSCESCARNFQTMLAVFANNGAGRFQLLTDRMVEAWDAGGVDHIIEFKQFKNGRLYFDTLNYSDSDAVCCPSKKGKTIYALKGNKLVKMRR